MATEKAETSCTPVVQSVEDQMVIEQELITYLQNILKHQIIPMNFMNLRKLVKNAPQKLKLYPYIQEKYPGEEFLAFLQKFPAVFMVNPDKSVQVYSASFCLQPQSSRENELSYDEVDGFDKGEYISDQESLESNDSDT